MDHITSRADGVVASPPVVDAVLSAGAVAFGAQPPALQLPGERTRNGRTAVGGVDVVLKVHPAQDLPEIELETAALLHLQSRPAVASLVPAPVTSPHSGGLVVPVDLTAVAVPVGPTAVVRALTWTAGRPWPPGSADADRLHELGALVAQVDAGLADLEHPGQRTLRWNLASASTNLDLVDRIADPASAAAVRGVLERARDVVEPALGRLPQQLIHNDANEANLVVGDDGRLHLIDFGDLCLAPRICGLAVAATYQLAAAALEGLPLWPVLRPLVLGYHGQVPLTPSELALLPALVRTRASVSVAMAAWQHSQDPDNEYLLVSQRGIQALLRALPADGDGLLHCRLRDAVGYEPHPAARAVRAHLATATAGPVLGDGWLNGSSRVLDWSGPMGAEVYGDGAAAAGGGDGVAAAGGGDGVAADRVLEIGRYGEDRQVYRTEAFAPSSGGGQRRTVHLGVDLFAPPGTPVQAALDGIVHAFGDNDHPLDYGPVVVLEHVLPDGAGPDERGRRFYTLYGHLTRASLPTLSVGQRVSAGQQIAAVGGRHENGGWLPHLHLQLFTDLMGLALDAPGVAARDDLAVWASISPDPNLLLGRPEGIAAHVALTAAQIRHRRVTSMSPALSLSYAEPLHIVAARGAELIDSDGRAWLDLVNNVAHVGHAHPRVVAAAAAQKAVLETNTRYLYPQAVEYARQLAGLLPDPLSVVFLVNSGSEANDLALRIAYAHTGSRDMLVLDHAYHGNLTSLVDLSPYKFAGPGGWPRPPTTHVVPIPDAYRGRYRCESGQPSSAVVPAYLAEVDARLDDVARAGRGVAGMIAEAIPGTAGQVVLADGFLAGAFERVRAAGGVCVADEVQVGLGRMGSCTWGFELHGVVPDIVTMGKPIGNGHPLGAVVCTPQVAHSFLTGMEYFNTFGGNAVSAAVGLAVLDVLADQRLQAQAARVGARLRSGLAALAERHELVGDVRGHGLFLGVELVTDRRTRAAAGPAASLVVEGAKRRGVLVSSDGPEHNVLKIKPPMVLGDDRVDDVVRALDEALIDVTAR